MIIINGSLYIKLPHQLHGVVTTSSHHDFEHSWLYNPFVVPVQDSKFGRNINTEYNSTYLTRLQSYSLKTLEVLDWGSNRGNDIPKIELRNFLTKVATSVGDIHADNCCAICFYIRGHNEIAVVESSIAEPCTPPLSV